MTCPPSGLSGFTFHYTYYKSTHLPDRPRRGVNFHFQLLSPRARTNRKIDSHPSI